jgi:hypothetical protein
LSRAFRGRGGAPVDDRLRCAPCAFAIGLAGLSLPLGSGLEMQARMERRRRRARERGSITVEQMIVLVIVVVPFSLVCALLGKHLVTYYQSVEYLNSLPMP